MKKEITIAEILKCINEEQIKRSDITFDENQLEYNELEFFQIGEYEIKEIEIIAKSRSVSEEEIRRFVIEIEKGKVRVVLI